MSPIHASTVDELLHILSKIDISVPERSQRTTAHVEQWSTARFLSTFAATGLFSYPIRVTPRDRPDVLLEMIGASIGVEITEAIPENWAKASALHEVRTYENLLFPPHFKPGESLRSTAELDKIARGEELGDGWVGDSPEREWADAMLHVARQKAAKLAEASFQRFDRDLLVIYDNWPLPGVDEKRAADYLRAKLTAECPPLPFDAIFVEGDSHFWHFENGVVQSVPINDVWNKR